MNYFIRFSFISLLFIFLHSCSQTPTKLKTAEQLMDTHPDSALKLLRTIKPTLFTSSANKALYALLYSQAMDKNEIKLESDSLISIATAYYDASEPDRAGYAWFYKSRCANNRGDAKMQADDLMKAQEYAEQTRNNKLKGLVYTEIGNMYGTQRQFYRSIFYLKEAYKLFIRVNDYRNSTLCLINIGYKYLYTTKAKKSIYYMLQAQQMATHCNDSLIDITITRHLGGAYYQLNNFQKAIDYLYKVRPSNNSYYDNNKLYILANIYSKLNKTDSVKHYLKKVNELFDMAPSYYQLWMTVYEKEQNVHAALYYSKKIAASTDSLYKRKLDVSFAGMEKKYNYQKLKISNQQLTISNKQDNILLLIVLVVLSFGIIAFMIWKNRLKNSQIAVQKKLVEHEKELLDKEIAANHLLEQQIKMQNIILKNIEQYRKNALKKSETAPTISPIQNSDFYDELLACMDLEYSNISKRLVSTYQDLTQRDILICCLILANFDTGMIASILDVKLESMNKQRYRLRTKLGLENSENLLEHLKNF